MAKTLDRSRAYGTNHPPVNGCHYEQDHSHFDNEGHEVDDKGKRVTGERMAGKPGWLTTNAGVILDPRTWPGIGTVDIPPDWETMNWLLRVKLARDITGESLMGAKKSLIHGIIEKAAALQ